MLAQAYEDLGRYGDARSQLFELIESLKNRNSSFSRQRALIMNNVGFLYARENAVDQAAQWLSRGIKECPDADLILYNNLAKAYLQQGKALDASQILIRARKHFRPNREAHLLLAVSLHRQRRNDEAVQELEDLIQTGEADAEAYADLGWILVDEKRDVESALRVLQEGHRRFGNDPKLINNLAYGLLVSGSPAPARALLESVPTQTGTLENRITLKATWGLLRIWEGDISEGVRCYKDAEEMANVDGNGDLARAVRQKMHLELARAYVRAGLLEAAREEIEKGLKVKGGRECYREDMESLQAPS
jgi:Tfp pilus assembly protein PilF